MTTTDTTPRPTTTEITTDLDWHGPSGETVPGTDTARHLEATLTLLNKRGWHRTTTSDTEDNPNPLANADDTWPVKRLLLGLARVVATELSSWGHGPLTLSLALSEISYTADGDDDTEATARNCIQAVLRLRTGARHPSLIAWSGKRGRTFDEVRDLLVEAAEFARTHGPTA